MLAGVGAAGCTPLSAIPLAHGATEWKQPLVPVASGPSAWAVLQETQGSHAERIHPYTEASTRAHTVVFQAARDSQGAQGGGCGGVTACDLGSGAAMTKDPTPRGSNKFTFSRSGSQTSKIKVSAVPVPPGGSEGGLCPVPLPAPGGSAILRAPGLVDSSPRLCLCHHGAAPCVSPC